MVRYAVDVSEKGGKVKRHSPTDNDFLWCPSCREYLHFSNFHSDKSRKDGRQGTCAKCRSIKHSMRVSFSETEKEMTIAIAVMMRKTLRDFKQWRKSNESSC